MKVSKDYEHLQPVQRKGSWRKQEKMLKRLMSLMEINFRMAQE
jgi:hypothetical protein